MGGVIKSMNRIPDSEKFRPDGRICMIDDRPLSPKEIKEFVAQLDPEYVEKIRTEIRERDRKRIQSEK